MVVRVKLYLPAALVQPRMPDVRAAQQLNQQIVAVVHPKPAHSFRIVAFSIYRVPRRANVIERCLTKLLDQRVLR